MIKTRITKEFNFEMAHALYNHDGKCANIHGHSYVLAVTLKGAPLNEPGHPKDGMLIDFVDLKALVHRAVVDPMDHAVVVNGNSPDKNLASGPAAKKIVLFNGQPTCENMVEDFARRIAQELPTGVELYSLLLRETASSYAEWYAQDQ